MAFSNFMEQIQQKIKKFRLNTFIKHDINNEETRIFNNIDWYRLRYKKYGWIKRLHAMLMGCYESSAKFRTFWAMQIAVLGTFLSACNNN